MTAVTAGVALAKFIGSGSAVEVTLALAGFADAHATAIAAFSLATEKGVDAFDPALLMLVGLSTNTVSKTVAAWVSGGRDYALRLLPALAAIVAAAWLAWYFAS